MYRVVKILGIVFLLGFFRSPLALAQLFPPKPPPRILTFPPDFLLGISTSSDQTERVRPKNDWSEWEKIPGNVLYNEPFETAWVHMTDEELVQILKEEGHNSHRFSLEWSRIEPERGVFDDKVLDEYARKLELLHANGIEPSVVFDHFTLPLWVRDEGSWEWSESPTAFNEYVRYSMKRLGSLIPRYAYTFNEPMATVEFGYHGFVKGEHFPPGKTDMHAAVRAIRNILIAHAKASHSITEIRDLDIQNGSRLPRISVGMIHQMVHFTPKNPASPLDIASTKIVDQFHNWTFLDAVQTGRFKVLIADAMGFPFLYVDEEIPHLKGSCKVIGVNYYMGYKISSPPRYKRKPMGTASFEKRISDMGWTLDPNGVEKILLKIKQISPDQDIIITEMGTADALEVGNTRSRLIKNTFWAIKRAMDKGVRVKGAHVWTLAKSRELDYGLGEESPDFGIFTYDPKTNALIPKQSAITFRKIATTHQVEILPEDNLIQPPPNFTDSSKMKFLKGVGSCAAIMVPYETIKAVAQNVLTKKTKINLFQNAVRMMRDPIWIAQCLAAKHIEGFANQNLIQQYFSTVPKNTFENMVDGIVAQTTSAIIVGGTLEYFSIVLSDIFQKIDFHKKLTEKDYQEIGKCFLIAFGQFDYLRFTLQTIGYIAGTWAGSFIPVPLVPVFIGLGSSELAGLLAQPIHQLADGFNTDLIFQELTSSIIVGGYGAVSEQLRDYSTKEGDYRIGQAIEKTTKLIASSKDKKELIQRELEIYTNKLKNAGQVLARIQSELQKIHQPMTSDDLIDAYNKAVQPNLKDPVAQIENRIRRLLLMQLLLNTKAGPEARL